MNQPEPELTPKKFKTIKDVQVEMAKHMADEPELTASEIKAIMDLQVEMIKYLNQHGIPLTLPYPDDAPWEMFFAE